MDPDTFGNTARYHRISVVSGMPKYSDKHVDVGFWLRGATDPYLKLLEVI